PRVPAPEGLGSARRALAKTRKATMTDPHDAPEPAAPVVTNVSRRGFLKGFGAGTVATSLLSPAAMREAAAAENGGWTRPGGNLCRCGTYAGMLLVAADLAKAKGGV